MKRLAVPIETRGFDSEANMVGNLSVIDDDDFSIRPVAGRYLAIITTNYHSLILHMQIK